MEAKKNILLIVPHRPNRSPGQRFRFEQYMEYLKQNNFSFTYSYLISAKDDKVFYSPKNLIPKLLIVIKSIFIRLFDVIRAPRFKIIFIYREAFMLRWIIFEKLLKLSGAKIIFDFDDAIWLNNISKGNENLNWLKSPQKTSKIIKLSNLVFAGNNYLAAYAKQYNSNVKVIPTTIDTIYHRNNAEKKSEKICIGWTGSATTLKYFKDAIPALKKVYKKYNSLIEFKVIVDIIYEEPDLNLKSTDWKLKTEIEDLSEINIGIMPLPDDEWAKGKCGFKGLQYMALEIPTVMSPVGVNTEIIEDGINGFLASTENEWVEKLSLLIESETLRKKLGKAGRNTVIEKYSFNSQKDRYLKYFNELIELPKPSK
ncbi:MAG: glycosyltransferase family 4 protein [Chlorobi bacterium]|nr:glycosyltransferase family 4 protein [Chlorobiota bacterium]